VSRGNKVHKEKQENKVLRVSKGSKEKQAHKANKEFRVPRVQLARPHLEGFIYSRGDIDSAPSVRMGRIDFCFGRVRRGGQNIVRRFSYQCHGSTSNYQSTFPIFPSPKLGCGSGESKRSNLHSDCYSLLPRHHPVIFIEKNTSPRGVFFVCYT
jgi:hypothetical protein